MFLFNRKSGARSKDMWDQAKYDYQEAVQRCYKWKGVTLALCGFRKFVAFNFECGLKKERRPLVEDDWQCWGVVHEREEDAKHVRCEVKIFPGPGPDHYIGWFALTHFSCPKDKTPREKQALQLDVTLRDPTGILKTSLIDGLRDAALSGFRFMHIGLECLESTDEELEKALSDIRAQGYACSRNILAIKMWPKIELENSPKWARRED